MDGVDLAAFAAAYAAHIINVNAHHAQVHLVSSHSDTALGAIANNDLWQWNDPGTVWVPKSIQEVILSQNINPGNITMNDDAWIGIGVALERMIFDAAGYISIMGANFGIQTLVPSQPLSVAEKSCMTAIGGFAIKLTNKTGANSIAGAVVTTSIGTNDAVMSAANDELEPIGVFLDDGVSDGSEAWVVVGGIADVAMEDNTTATRGNWVRTSVADAPYADATNAVAPGHGIGNADIHFHEIGHCIETVTAGGLGTHILARCVLHFN